MPSIFTLDGPRLGDAYLHNPRGGLRAIAVPSYQGPRRVQGSLGVTAVEYGRQIKARIFGPQTISGAVSTGLGELPDKVKTGLVAAAVLGVIGVVAWSGAHRNRYRSLRGVRSRRRRRR